MIPTDRIIDWLQRTVQIPSVGPENAGQRSGDSSEARLAEFLADAFAEFGGEVHSEDVRPGRPNVYAIWRGTSDRWLAVDVHMDTVSVETMQGDPFDGRVADGRVYGRGAVDTKASFGIVLALLEKLHQSGQKPDANLLVVATAMEETGAIGAVSFADWVRAQHIQLDQLLVAEPTLCGPIYGHKGGVGLEVTVQGKAAHTSEPENGQNAIYQAAALITAVAGEHERLRSLEPDPELGTASTVVSLIRGGQAANIVPDECGLRIGRRLVTGEDPEATAQQLFAYLKRLSALPLRLDVTFRMNSFLQPPDSPWVQQLAAWSGVAPTVAPYGTNAHAYNGLARECVVFGPGSIEQAHRDVEWVEVAELEKAARIYERWLGLSG